MTKGHGGREGEIVTLQHRFSTHTYFEFDYIITAHMSLQKGMGSRGAYTHTKQRRIPHLCTKQVRCAGTTQTPKARARSSQEVPTVPPIAGVGILEVPQLPLVDNETQPLCSTRPGTRFTDEWAGI